MVLTIGLTKFDRLLTTVALHKEKVRCGQCVRQKWKRHKVLVFFYNQTYWKTGFVSPKKDIRNFLRHHVVNIFMSVVCIRTSPSWRRQLLPCGVAFWYYTDGALTSATSNLLYGNKLPPVSQISHFKIWSWLLECTDSKRLSRVCWTRRTDRRLSNNQTLFHNQPVHFL